MRLDSISEILTLQEADITKVTTHIPTHPLTAWLQRSSNEMDRVRGLLTRWREKVYALLVQQKLQEIEEVRKREETQRKV